MVFLRHSKFVLGNSTDSSDSNPVGDHFFVTDLTQLNPIRKQRMFFVCLQFVPPNGSSSSTSVITSVTLASRDLWVFDAGFLVCARVHGKNSLANVVDRSAKRYSCDNCDVIIPVELSDAETYPCSDDSIAFVPPIHIWVSSKRSYFMNNLLKKSGSIEATTIACE